MLFIPQSSNGMFRKSSKMGNEYSGGCWRRWRWLVAGSVVLIAYIYTPYDALRAEAVSPPGIPSDPQVYHRYV